MNEVTYKSAFTRKEIVITPWKFEAQEKLVPFCYREHTLSTSTPLINTISLREYQKSIFSQAMVTLKKQGCIFLALHCGFGKTIMANKIICELGITPALIITIGSATSTQFYNTIRKYSNSSVSIIDDELTFSDINIVTIQMLVMRGYTSKDLARYKVVVVDEAVTMCTQKRNNVLVSLSPQYFIGMCADVERDDGFDSLLDMHFGKRDTWIFADNSKAFTFYKINTRFKPEVKFNHRTQKIDWHAVTKSLAINEDRNNKIVEYANMFRGDKVIIMTKSTEECDTIYDMLKDQHVNVQRFYKTDSLYYNCDVLVTTYSKSTRGLDDANVCPDTDGRPFRVAILCSDSRKMKQLIGRVMRSNKPVVLYLVDDFSSLRKHWDEAEQEILSLRGNIIELYI